MDSKTQELADYVSQRITLGHSKIDIVNDLIDLGWESQSVEQFVDRIEDMIIIEYRKAMRKEALWMIFGGLFCVIVFGGLSYLVSQYTTGVVVWIFPLLILGGIVSFLWGLSKVFYYMKP